MMLVSLFLVSAAWAEPAGGWPCGYRAELFAAQDYVHDAIPDLQTPATDVTKLAQVLQERFGFVATTHLNASRSDLLDTLHRLHREVRDCEAVLVYYAGHGIVERKKTGYWLGVDADPASRATWITNADVRDELERLPARHVLLIADSCFSGTLLRATRAVDILPEAESDFLGLAGDRSRWVLTSGGVEPVEDQYRDGMSVFAYFLHQQLSQTTERYVMADTLFPELRQLTRINARQRPEQGPMAGHEGGQLVMVHDAASPISTGATSQPPAARGTRSFAVLEQRDHQLVFDGVSPPVGTVLVRVRTFATPPETCQVSAPDSNLNDSTFACALALPVQVTVGEPWKPVSGGVP